MCTARRRFTNVRGLMFALLVGFPLATGFAQEQDEAAGRKVYEAGEVYLSGSRVYIHVGKTGFGHEHAVEGELSSGTLSLTEPTGELVFAMKTFTADTAAARKYIGLSGTTDAGTQAKVNANMRGSHVLHVNRYPQATFKVTGVRPLEQQSRRGLPQYQIDGEFTLHGRTRPLRFTADVDKKDGWLHVRGGFSILQTDYGITPYSAALGTIGVADKLTIWGDLWVAERRQVLADKKSNNSRN